ADANVVEVVDGILGVQANTTSGSSRNIALVECVAVVGEVHGVRHWGVTELVGDFILDLAVDVERSARGFLANSAGGNWDCTVGDLSVFLQPGTSTVDVDAHIGGGWAGTTVETGGGCCALGGGLCCCLRRSLCLGLCVTGG